MNRRGFALLSVLWLSVVLSALAAGVMDIVRVETRAASNRMHSLRGAWARAACHEILQARYARRVALRSLDTVDLGRGTWCVASIGPPIGIDLNHATGDQLRRAIGSDSLTTALLDWIDTDTIGQGGSETDWYRLMQRRPPRNGPLASLSELLLIRGFDSALVARVATVAHALPLDFGSSCPRETRCPESSTLIADVEAGFRGSPIRSRGRWVYRTAGIRLAVLLQELE